MCLQVDEPINYWDIASKVGTLLIGITGVIVSAMVFKIKDKKDDIHNQKDELRKEKERKIQWLKTLVLDYSFAHFYSTFDKVEEKLEALKIPSLSITEKQAIDSAIQDDFIFLRRKFTDSILAIDESLYQSILNLTDSLQTYLSNSIFDNGINLSHPPKFNEIISEQMTIHRTAILKKLFEYNG